MDYRNIGGVKYVLVVNRHCPLQVEGNRLTLHETLAAVTLGYNASCAMSEDVKVARVITGVGRINRHYALRIAQEISPDPYVHQVASGHVFTGSQDVLEMAEEVAEGAVQCDVLVLFPNRQPQLFAEALGGHMGIPSPETGWGFPSGGLLLSRPDMSAYYVKDSWI